MPDLTAYSIPLPAKGAITSTCSCKVELSVFSKPYTCFDPSNLNEAKGVRNSQVPIQGYAAQEGDADIDVSVEDEAKQLAALLTMDPVIVLQKVVDPQRKRGDVEEVGHRQVDQVDAELVALAYLEIMQWRSRRRKIKASNESRIGETRMLKAKRQKEQRQLHFWMTQGAELCFQCCLKAPKITSIQY